MAKNTLVFIVFLALAIFVTWPLAISLDHLIIDRYDSLLIVWIQNWVLHSPLALNANIFYPYQNTLAFSDYHLVSALIGAPFVWLTREPLVSFNVNLILGLALTGLATYLLTKHLTKQAPVSFLAGTLLTFSTIHLNYLAHPQLFHIWLIILPILFLLQKHKKLFALFFILAVANSPLNFYFLLFFGLLLRKNLRWALASVFLSVPLLIPYFLVSRQFNYVRPITDAINFSLQFPDLVNVSSFSRLGQFVAASPGTPAYLGGVFLILILLMIHKSKFNRWLLGAGVSFILALGPALHIFRNTVHLGPIPALPLPYALFYYLVPGFSAFRTPSRWILITAACLTVAIALHFAKRITWPWAIVLSGLVLLEVNFPLKYVSVPSVSQFPPEQVWLKDNYIGAPIIQFPIYGWFDGQNLGVETLREYYSTIHWHPMVNGYSGYSPTEWENRVKWLQKNFPSSETIDYLENLGVKLVLVPADLNPLCCQNKLKLVARFPNAYVYAFSDHSSQK
ncbi:hypothetical protein HY440_02360 [Candidatus Microgenomates bacterium]|nr:hypothetical protein [Candidatus Microgenomates bacterium]